MKRYRLTENSLRDMIREAVKSTLNENNWPSDEARAIQVLDFQLRNVSNLLSGSLDTMWSTFALKDTQDPASEKMYRTIGNYIQDIETQAQQLTKTIETTKSLLQQAETYNQQNKG